MPKAFNENEKLRIELRLREEGSRLFSTYGLKKTNVEEIARAAGISKGAFYLFFPSKEDLFFSVVEDQEKHLREQILDWVDRPGPSPRARLAAVFHRAFALLKSLTILQFFTPSDYAFLFSGLSRDKFQRHLAADQDFISIVIARCQSAGIPVRVSPGEMMVLLFPLVVALLNEAPFGTGAFSAGIETLLDLSAAYCLGEIQLLSAFSGGKENQPNDLGN